MHWYNWFFMAIVGWVLLQHASKWEAHFKLAPGWLTWCVVSNFALGIAQLWAIHWGWSLGIMVVGFLGSVIGLESLRRRNIHWQWAKWEEEQKKGESK